MAKDQRRGFITAGTWCVDYNKIVSHWPEEDGLAQYHGEQRHGGGSGCNLALDMKGLDPAMPVDTIALIGDDDAGRFLIALADAAGIGRQRMQVTSKAPTHTTDAFVSQASHRRTHIFNAGAANLLSPDHFDFTATGARILHLGLPGVHQLIDGPWGSDANGWITILKKARAAGLKSNLELASFGNALIAKLVIPCLPHLDMIIVNDIEIGALSGLDTVRSGVTDIAACERAACQVIEKGAMEIVVVHSPVIAIAVTRDGATITKPSVQIPQSEVASANGAGDAFASGMLYGLHENWSIADSLALAHAAAACSLRSLATTGAVEPWRKCLELASQWGWRPS